MNNMTLRLMSMNTPAARGVLGFANVVGLPSGSSLFAASSSTKAVSGGPRWFATHTNSSPLVSTSAFALNSRKSTSLALPTISTISQKRSNASESVHPKIVDEKDYLLHHPVYTKDQLEKVPVYHRDANDLSDRVAYGAVKLMRAVFDKVTGYVPESEETREGRITSENSWMTRFLFLETIAGVPPFMAAMARHLRSLRRMQRDNGWIHTLLEEAENERMHLLTFLSLRKPGYLFRGLVILAQGVMANAYFLAYLISPKTCHRFVGYIEEEAVHTYTHALREIDSGIGPLAVWKTKPAPEIAIKYWKLDQSATMRDVIAAIRVDEASHRDVNHTFGSLKPDEKNPF